MRKFAQTSPSSIREPRFSRVGLIVLGICWATIIADGYDVVVFGAVLPSLLQEDGWGLTPASAGVIGSYALIGMFIGSMTIGTVTDRLGRKPILILCVSWFSVFTAMCAIAPSPETFGLFRFLAGLGLGGVLPTASALVAEYSAPRSRKLAYALLFTGFPIGGILAALTGLAVIPNFGWRPMFVVALLPMVLIIPFAIRYLPESIAFLLARGRQSDAELVATRHDIPLPIDAGQSESSTEQASTLRTLSDLVSRRYALATLCFCTTSFLCLFMIYGLNTWLPQIMRESGYSLGSALSFLLVFNLGAIAGTVLIAMTADRLDSKPVIVSTFVLASSAVGLLSLNLPTIALYVLVALGGTGVIATQAFINAYVSQHYPVRMGGTALGWSLGVGRLGSIAAPPVLGLLLGSAIALQWNFYVIAIAGLLGAAITMIVPPSPANPSPSKELDSARNRDVSDR